VNLSGVPVRGGGLGFGDLIPSPRPVRPRRQRPRAPRPEETAIEAPFRLILSPSTLGGFAHATLPRAVPPDPARIDDPERVELWHSRLGVRRVAADGEVTIDETSDPQKAVRAIWARDEELPGPIGIPLTSLTAQNRKDIVRLTADPLNAPPQPVEAERLYLTALGSWLELHGRWNDSALVAWDHEATGGRDQYVRVVEPYYLFPFGHRCSLVTITERKIKKSTDPQARLYQRMFITIAEPVKTFSSLELPFIQVRIRPLVTPNLDYALPLTEPPEPAGSVPDLGKQAFWPTIGGVKFRFVLDCLDHEGKRVVLPAPLLAVAEALPAASRPQVVTAYETDPERPIGADGQSVAMAASTKPGDTAFETIALRFTGTPAKSTSTPRLVESDVVVPSMRHLAPASPRSRSTTRRRT